MIEQVFRVNDLIFETEKEADWKRTFMATKTRLETYNSVRA